MIDIAEQICLAVDEIITKRLENIKYDTTIIGTIVDNTEALQYRYTCSNGSSNFIAYAKDTTYKVGDSVQITIPNGDYDQQKIIIGKYVAEDNDTPYVFIQPFDTIIDISSNLINDNKEVIYGSLLANDDYDTSDVAFNKEVHLYTRTFETPQTGFTRLGLAGQFRTWISSFKPISGNFGYRLEIFSQNPEIVGTEKVSIKDWVDLYGRVLNGEENLNEAGLLDNTPDSWYDNVMPKEEFIKSFEDIDNRINLTKLMLYNNSQVSFWELESKDMYGNPYNFQSYFSQEVVFDISKVELIVGMTLFFYETSNTFFNENNEPVTYKDNFGNKLPPNLFTKDPYICLGYSLEGFDKEDAILYTIDSKGYRFEGNPDTEENKLLNKKTVRLRWLHEFDNGDIHVINDDTEIGEFEVRWYKYKLGSPSADEYSGVYWQRVDNNSESVFDFSFVPAYNLPQEQIKAIILYEGNIIRSNILTFNNEKEVANSATAELLAGLSIWCQDNTYGNYYIYGQNNDAFRADDINRIRTLEARFADRSTITSGADVDKNADLLTEAQTIVWEFPLNNTMFVVQGFNYNYKQNIKEEYSKEILDKTEDLWYNIIEDLDPMGNIYKMSGYYTNGEVIKVDGNSIKIIRYGQGNQIYALQDYRIQKTYAATKINNTVKCSIDKNGYTYSASKDFSFGLMGTNGTDATLVIDFNNNITALTANEEETVKVSARLYDNNHNEVDFYNNDLNLQCEWKWAYYHEFSKEREDQILAEALAAQELKAEDLTYGELQKIRAEAVGKAGSVQIDEHDTDEAVNICYLSHNKNLPMNDEGLFMILQATVKGWGNYDLTAYKAIPVRSIRNYRYIVGPTDIIYNSAGYVDYYKGPYEIYYAEKVDEGDIVPSEIKIEEKEAEWRIFDPYWDEEEENKYIGGFKNNTNILQPASMYFEDTDPYGTRCYINNQLVWIQPLVIMQNRYPSATINKWDGKSIEINDKEGYILAPAIAAGKKHSDNSFSGVMIGDWSGPGVDIGGTADEITKQTGVYGFNHGAMAYALMEDGTAFIGKDGRGRIYFDGNDAKIYSATYNIGVGMMIDLGGDNESPFIDIKALGSNILLKAEEGGSEIEFRGSGGRITISSKETKNPLEIGNNFEVDWEGNLYANDAHLNDAVLENVYASGEIAANEGVIGGWKIVGQLLQGGVTTFKSGTDYDWISAGKANNDGMEIFLDASTASIAGGRLKPTSSGRKMELWGSFEICDEKGNSVTGNYGNYLGFVTSGLPDENGNPTNAEGIGMVVENHGALKVTKDNIGLQFGGTATSGGGGFISISGKALTISTVNTQQIAIYGTNIYLDQTAFEIKNIAPEKQKGIYARFA